MVVTTDNYASEQDGDQSKPRGLLRHVFDPSPEPEAEEVAGPPAQSASRSHPWRSVAAWGMGILLGLVGLMTIANVGSAEDASAPQVIQIYTEGLFMAVIVIGIGIAIYIGSRSKD